MGENLPRLRQRLVQCVEKLLPASKVEAALHSLSRLLDRKKCVLFDSNVLALENQKVVLTLIPELTSSQCSITQCGKVLAYAIT